MAKGIKTVAQTGSVRDLSAQQTQFANEYMVDFNATRAAVRAGYSTRSAASQGQRLLKNAKVAALIDRLRADLARQTGITAERVLAELGKIAFADAGDYFTWGPGGVTLVDSEDLSPAQRAAVVSVSETTTEHGGTIKLVTADKLSALEKIGRHLGMFHDHVRIDPSDALSELMDQVNGATHGRLPNNRG